MSGFTAAWIIWGIYFLAVEGIALFNKQKGDTLSEHVWKWTGLHRDGPLPIGYQIRRAGLALGMIVLTLHLVRGEP
jgi:hypothetical protein